MTPSTFAAVQEANSNFCQHKSKNPIILLNHYDLQGMKVLITGPSRIFSTDTSALSKWKQFAIKMFLILVCPIAPTLLLFLNARLGRAVRVTDKKFKKATKEKISIQTSKLLLEAHIERRETMKKQHDLEKILVKSYLMDICLENTPQILVQFLIVLMAASTQRFDWLSGTEAVFDYHDSSSTISTWLFYFSIAWSLRSIHSGLFSTFLYKKDYSVGDLGKVLMFIVILIGSFLRIFAIILAFTPFLGLFDMMVFHQQDSKLEYSPNVWEMYKTTLTPSRNYTWYTGTSFPTFLWVLALSPIIHVVGVNCLRLLHIKGLRERFSLRLLINLSINSFTTLIIPTVYRDWDEHSASQPEVYQQQWLSAKKEYVSMVMLHLVENLLLLSPVCLNSFRKGVKILLTAC